MLQLKNIIKESIREVLNEKEDKIVIYHGTPFEKNAIGIKNNGLQQVGDFIIAGGDGSPSINGRSYVAKELWNAVRYSFFKPSSMNLEWNDYTNKYPFGYVFEFNIKLSELLPDEDAIGEMVGDFLNKNKNKFLGKYLNNIDKNLLYKVKQGSFDGFAEIGKIIEPMLTKEDIKTIVLNSRTGTVNKNIIPIKSYKIKKPNTQFFNTENKYLDWFYKYRQIF